MKIAICDDEVVMMKSLEKRISAYFQQEGVEHIIDSMTDPTHLLDNKQTGYDVVFLDVDMGEWNGIDVAQHMRRYDASLLIVYVSGYIKYSPMGYTVNAFRYLLKSELDENLEECLIGLHQKLLERQETLTIKCGVDTVSLALHDIVYIESQRAVLIFHVINNEESTYRSYETMQAMDVRLAPNNFLRVQKSYIVNMQHVKQIKNYQVVMNNGITIQASRNDFQNLQRKYLLWKGR